MTIRCPMTFTVVGAGAIGGTVGAHLVRAGATVRFVDSDPEHVEAMRAGGLVIETPSGLFNVATDARLPGGLDGPPGVVLLAVKSQHTAAALEPLLPALARDGVVVSLQNGINEPLIADRVGPDRTLGAMVNFAADYIAPGRIRFYAPGTVVLGQLDGTVGNLARSVAAELRGGFPVEVTDNIWGYLWTKVGGMAMTCATAASGEQPADAVDRYRHLMVELASEVYDVAAREGVRLHNFDGMEPSLYLPRIRRQWRRINASLDAYIAHARAGKKKSGIWRDIAVRHRPTEVDELVGVAVPVGERHGLQLPLTRALIRMIHEIEAGQRPMGWANLDELESLRAAHYGS